MPRFPSVVLAALALSSCHCYQTIDRVIIDANRITPIEGVSVRYAPKVYRHAPELGNTDRSGRFSHVHRSGGLWCSFAVLEFSAYGYQADTVKFDRGQDTVRLAPIAP